MNRPLIPLAVIVLIAAGRAEDKQRIVRTPEYRALQTKLCRGWNTWSAESVMSHVFLPDGFALTLGIKSADTGRAYQRSFFQVNRAANRTEKIRLGPHADDGSFTELTLDWDGGHDEPMTLLIQSAVEQGEEHILVTVQKKAVQRPDHLIVEAGYYWNRPGTARREGATVVAESQRRFVVRATAAGVHDAFIPANGPYLSFALDRDLAVYTGAPKTLEQIRAIVQSARAKHVAALESHGKNTETFTAMQTILAWNLTYDPESERAISPVSRWWSANWGGFVLFDWDTYFASFMYSLYNADLAMANAVEITKGITTRGFIPNCYLAYGIRTEDRSQPPVGSMMALEIYKRHPQRWFLEEIYPELLRWNRWWPGARGCGKWLCWGSDENPDLLSPNRHDYQSALFESGLDNSPMYDGVPFNKKTSRLEMADVGLTSLYTADCAALAEVADLLGKRDDARELRTRREQYAQALEEMWDERTGMYLNRRSDTGEPSPKLSPTNFYPLIARVASEKKAVRMIREHYFNPAEFHGEWVIPSIARNVEGFKDQVYWRGRIWGPMNFLVYLGMRNYPVRDARRDLVERSLALLMKGWRGERAVYENYNAITGSGGEVESSDIYYHWGALLGVLSMLED